MLRLTHFALMRLALAVVAACASFAGSAEPRFEFTRMVAHWAKYGDPAYLSFIEEAQPEVAQVGFYGAHFWSLAHTKWGKGYPAHFPVQGHAECGKWFQDLNGELHRRRCKVVGHVNVKFLVGDPDGPDGPRGFFDFYRNRWDEKRLGPKPVKDPREFLEVDRESRPISNKNYSIGGMREYWACLNNPHWRSVLKAFTKNAVDRGVDGLMINYFYRHDCHCKHCVAGFKKHLASRHSTAELKRRFGIDDLAKHTFKEIVAWHKPAESTPLRREMLRWSQIANKRAFDEVFVRYGRSLKPDLLVAQWNHLGAFSQINGDERCLLPGELWGKDESYLWYSTGGSAHFTDLKAGNLGEGTLHARYIRGAFDDKPFTLGKYENTRIRTAIAELAANGGAPMGFYTRFTDSAARKEIVRYYHFLKRYDAVYRGNRPYSEVALLFPRSRVHAGDVAAVAKFREVGKQLLDQHVLFDVLPDDLATPAARKQCGAIIDPTAPAPLKSLPKTLSRFKAPTTVRVSASRPAKSDDEIAIHLVNYNRIEPAKARSAGRGIVDEKPISVESVEIAVQLPPDRRGARVTFATPEEPDEKGVEYRQTDGVLRATLPRFLVYAVVRVRFSRTRR